MARSRLYHYVYKLSLAAQDAFYKLSLAIRDATLQVVACIMGRYITSWRLQYFDWLMGNW